MPTMFDPKFKTNSFTNCRKKEPGSGTMTPVAMKAHSIWSKSKRTDASGQSIHTPF